MDDLGWMSTDGLVVIGAGLAVLVFFLVPRHGFGFTLSRFHKQKPGYFQRVLYWLVGFGVFSHLATAGAALLCGGISRISLRKVG